MSLDGKALFLKDEAVVMKYSGRTSGKLKLLFLLLVVNLPVLSGQESYRLLHRFSSYSAIDTAAVKSLVRRGCLQQRHHPDSAMALFREAALLSRNKGFEDGMGLSLMFMGLTATNLGHNDEAFTFYREALPYCLRARQLKEALPLLYFAMAVSWDYKDDRAKAMEYYYKALGHLQQYLPRDRNIGPIHMNLSILQRNLGRYPEAFYHIRQAEQKAVREQNQFALASVLLNKGALYAALHQKDSARHYYLSSLDLALKFGYQVVQQASYTGLGELCLEEKHYDAAVGYFRQGLRSGTGSNTNPYPRAIGPAYGLGLALYHLGQYPEAERVLLDALDKAAQTGLMVDRQGAHATLASLYEATGRSTKALQQWRMYAELKDSSNSLGQIRIISEVEGKYKSAQKDKLLAEKELKIVRSQKQLERRNILIACMAGGVLLTVTFVWLLYRSRNKMNKREREIERLKAVMTGEEQERTRISRELHDGIGGMLTGIKMNVMTLQEQQKTAPHPGGLDDIMELLQDMGAELHKTAQNLMPDVLLKHKLEEALLLYCEQLDTNGRLKVDLQLYGVLEGLASGLELPLYRMIQELIQNTIKHAGASLLAIQVRCAGGKVCISVEDNGRGFDPGTNRAGLGLRNIEARVAALGGYFSLESAPGAGTTAYIEIDFENK